MAAWVRCRDEVDVNEQVFGVPAKYAPDGTLDVFASDQHSSDLRLFNSFLEHIGEDRQATDEDVRDVCRRFARALDQTPSAALFNHLACLSPDFRGLLGPKTIETDGGRGHLARLAVEPEEVADCVDMLADAEERQAVGGGQSVGWLTPGWLRHWRYIPRDWDRGKANETFPQNSQAVLLEGIGYYDEVVENGPELLLGFSDFMKIPVEPYPVALDRLRNLLKEQSERSA